MAELRPDLSATGADPLQDTLVIDPVTMNIVNRVASGTSLSGHFTFKGGLLLQGTLQGQGEIDGRLVVWHTGQLVGRHRVLGDMYVLGHLGGVVDDVDADTVVECHGTAYVAATAVCTGTIIATRLRMYDGATLQGPFKTLHSDRRVPVLKTRAE